MSGSFLHEQKSIDRRYFRRSKGQHCLYCICVGSPTFCLSCSSTSFSLQATNVYPHAHPKPHHSTLYIMPSRLSDLPVLPSSPCPAERPVLTAGDDHLSGLFQWDQMSIL